MFRCGSIEALPSEFQVTLDGARVSESLGRPIRSPFVARLKFTPDSAFTLGVARFRFGISLLLIERLASALDGSR